MSDMISDVLHTGKIAFSNLRPLLKECTLSEKAWLLAEHLPDHIITHAERQELLHFDNFEMEIPFERYTSGRIFQEDYELRWEKQEQDVQVVYLGAESQTQIIAALRDYRITINPKVDVASFKPKTTQYFLLGERLEKDDVEKIGGLARPGDFAEARIPRLLRYPHIKPPTNLSYPKVEGEPKYLCLDVVEYEDKATGQLMLFRFKNLTPGG